MTAPSRSRPLLMWGVSVASSLLIGCGGKDSTAPPTSDTTAPTVSIVVSAGTYTSKGAKVGLTATASDNVGVTHVEFYKRRVGVDVNPVRIADDSAAPFAADFPPAGFVGADDGSYEFSAKAYDAAGNVGTNGPVSVSVAIDTTPPVVTLHAVSTAITTPGHLLFTVDQALARVELYDGATKIADTACTCIPVQLTVHVTRADNGLHTYTAKGYDGNDNVGTSNPVPVLVDIRWSWYHPLADIGGLAVTTDGSGGVYLAGGTDGLSGSGGEGDVALVKYDTVGNELWRRRFGNSTSSETARGIAHGPGDVVYVSGEDYVYGVKPVLECVLLKYDASGTLHWVRLLGNGTTTEGCVVATDGAGDVYLAGSTYGDFSGTDSTSPQHVFLAKYDSGGGSVWIRQFTSSTAGDFGIGVTVDSSGGVYVGGYTPGSIPGFTNAGNYDFLLIKYDANGTEQWARLLGTPDIDEAAGVGAEPSGGVYIAGWNRGGLDTTSSTPFTALVVARYDAAGGLVWVRQLANNYYTYGTAVAADTGAVWVVGLGDGPRPANVWQAFDDLLLVKYAKNGDVLSLRTLGSDMEDQGVGVAAPGGGNVYVAGIYDSDGSGPLHFGVIARHKE